GGGFMRAGPLPVFGILVALYVALAPRLRRARLRLGLGLVCSDRVRLDLSRLVLAEHRLVFRLGDCAADGSRATRRMMRALALCIGIMANAAYAQGAAYTEVFYPSGSLRIQAYLYRPQ